MLNKKFLVIILFTFLLVGCASKNDTGHESSPTGANRRQHVEHSSMMNKVTAPRIDEFKYPADWPDLEIKCNSNELNWLMGDSNYSGKEGGQVGNTYFGMNDEHVTLLKENAVKPEAIILFEPDEVKGLNKPSLELKMLNQDNSISAYPLNQNSMQAPKEVGEYIFILSVDWGNGDNNILYWFKLGVRADLS